MKLSITFTRILFLALCTLFSVLIATSEKTPLNTPLAPLIGGLGGLAFGSIIIGLDNYLKSLNLRSFNAATLGIVFGYLLGEALMLVVQTVMNTVTTEVAPMITTTIRAGVLLTTSYLGMVITMRASNELYACVPFVQFKTVNQKRKDFVIDFTALSDPRLIDLATTGVVDQRLVIPNFAVKELNEQLEADDEAIRTKARRSLDAIKKLESIPELELRLVETIQPDAKDLATKLARAARQLEANILTADASRNGPLGSDGIRYININALSSSLKSQSQTGEILNIKIQRYGKEPRQGVGYLEDGTMVVVNGGAEFIGETIRVQVLSVKHTSSGRMIFCNTLENDLSSDANLATPTPSASNYFAL